MQDTPSLIGALVRDTSELISVEGRLLRAEMREAGGQAQAGLMMVGAGALLALVGLGALAGGAVLLLVRYHLPPDIACAIVGGIALIVSIALLLLARGRLTPAALMPHRTLRQMASALTGESP